MQAIVPQHFLHAAELANRVLLGLLLECLLLRLLLGSEFAVHKATSSGFFEKDGKGLARTVKFAADRVGRLLGQCADLIIAQLLIGDQ